MKIAFKISIIMAMNTSLCGFAADKPVIYGESGSIKNFDPFTIHEAQAYRLADLLFDSMITIGPGGTYEPSLAEKWQIHDGGTKVELWLRNDVLWNDPTGMRRFTADDIVTTLRLIKSPNSEIPNQGRFDAIANATKLSDDHIEITFTRALTDPLRLLTFKILPSFALGVESALTRKHPFSSKPIGSGPYYIEKVGASGEVVMRANRRYFRGIPTIESLVMKNFADQNVMAQALMFSSLDLVTYTSPRDVPELKGDKSVSVIPYDSLSYSFIAINNDRPFLKHKSVRQALSYAVNRDEMLKAFFQGEGVLISGPFPPTSWAYNLTIKPIPYDIQRAKNLLHAAGYTDHNKDGLLDGPDKKTISLSFAVPLAGESEMVKRIALAYQGYLAQIGIKIDLKFVDWLVWKDQVLNRRDFDLTIASWNFDDSSNISSLFHSANIKPWGNNFVGFHSEHVDALLTEAEVTNDFDKRRAIYHKLHQILADETPYTYLWHLKHHAAIGSRLKNVQIEPFAFFKHVVDWRLKGKSL